MSRNLHKRVELMFTIKDKKVQKKLWYIRTWFLLDRLRTFNYSLQNDFVSVCIIFYTNLKQTFLIFPLHIVNFCILRSFQHHFQFMYTASLAKHKYSSNKLFEYPTCVSLQRFAFVTIASFCTRCSDIVVSSEIIVSFNWILLTFPF